MQYRYFYTEFATTGQILFSSMHEMQTAVTCGAPHQLTRAPMYRANILFDHDDNPQTAPVARDSMVQVVSASPDYAGPTDNPRADIRFGRQSDGTLYLMSKRNRWVYRIVTSVPR